MTVGGIGVGGNARARAVDMEIKVFKSEKLRLTHELASMREQLKDNVEKVKLNKQLPYLVSNVVEVCAGPRVTLRRSGGSPTMTWDHGWPRPRRSCQRPAGRPPCAQPRTLRH